MGLENTQGVLIRSVSPGRAADKAGRQKRRYRVEVDGQPVHNAVDLRSQIGRTAPGVEVELLVLRDGEQKRIEVELESLTEEVLATSAGARGSNEVRGPLGIRVENLKDEWAERLGYEDESGVMIVRVARGSEAAKRGLRRGMLIQEINGEQVETVEDYEDALEEIEPGSAFMIRVLGEQGTRLVGCGCCKLSMCSQAIWHPAALAVVHPLRIPPDRRSSQGLLRCAASGPYEV